MKPKKATQTSKHGRKSPGENKENSVGQLLFFFEKFFQVLDYSAVFFFFCFELSRIDKYGLSYRRLHYIKMKLRCDHRSCNCNLSNCKFEPGKNSRAYIENDLKGNESCCGLAEVSLLRVRLQLNYCANPWKSSLVRVIASHRKLTYTVHFQGHENMQLLGRLGRRACNKCQALENM